MSETRGQGTAGTTTQAKFTVGRSPAEAAKEVAIPEDAEIILTQEEGTTTASLAPLVLEKPAAGITETVVWTPGTPLVTAFPLDSAASVVTEVIDGVTYTVFTWPDGAVLRVAGLDPEDQGIGDLPVTLEDGTVVGLEDFAAIAGVEPAAGPGAAAPGVAGPGNNGHGTGPAGPGGIGSGPGDTGPLGYTELQFSVPELTEDTDPLEEEEAEPGLFVSINSVEVTEGDPIEVDGGEGEVQLLQDGLIDHPFTTITFTVSLNAPSTEPVTVHYVVNQGTGPTGAFEGIVIQNPGGPEGDYTGPISATQVPADSSGVVFKLANNVSVPDADGVPSGSSYPPSVPTSDGPSTGYQSGTFVFAESGTFLMAWGAFNEGDTLFDYHLLLDNIQLNGVLLEGFEGGAFTNPDIGPVLGSSLSFEGNFAGVDPTQGTGQLALLSEGIDAGDLAVLLGVPEATIQAILDQLGGDGDPYNGDENLTDGSILAMVLTVNAGDVLTFDFDHIAEDGNGPGYSYNDTSLFYSEAAGSFSSTYATTSPLEGDITFAPGETSKTITLNIVDDTVFEPTEQFTVVLSDPVGASIATNPGVGTILDNDPAPTLLIGDASAFEGDALVFDLVLTNASSETIVVQLSTASGSAAEGTDFTSIDGTLVTFNPGETATTVTVSSLEDEIFEPNELFSVTGAQVSGTVTIGNTGTGTILDDDPTPSLLIGDATAQEGDVLTFSVTLSNPSFETIVVSLNTATGSADEGTDFASIDGTLVTFLAGQTSTTVTVSSTEDDAFEPDETFSVTATQVSGSVNIFDSGTGTILDDDALPTVTIDNQTVTEGVDPAAVFTVTLSNPSADDIVLNFTTTDGTAFDGDGEAGPGIPDYSQTTGSITIVAGTTSTTITVPIADDVVFELTESFTVNLTPVDPSQINVGASDLQGAGTIIDNDGQPTVVIGDAFANEGNVLVFDLTLLGGPSAEEIVIRIDTESGTALEGPDFASGDGATATFAPGETTATVTVSSLEDDIFEPDETFIVTTTAVSGSVHAGDSGIGTILDNDEPPAFSIDDMTVTEGINPTIVFTVTKTGATVFESTVQYVVNQGSALTPGDYTAQDPLSGTLTFAAGETVKTITLNVTDDAVFEPTESFTVDLTNAVSATISDDQGVGTILDNDGVLEIEKTAALGDEGEVADAAGDIINYTITVTNLGAGPIANVVVNDPFIDNEAPVLNGLFNVGDTNQNNLLDVGEAWLYTGSYVVTQADIDAGETISNVATASADDHEPVSDDATVPVEQNAELTVVKEVDSVEGGGEGGVVDSAGDVIFYTITVENTGNTSLTGIVVSDPFADSDPVRGLDISGNDDDVLDPGEIWSYAASHVVTQEEIDSNGGGNGSLENVAIVTSTESPPGSDDASVPVAQIRELAITKDATVPGGTADVAGEVISYTIAVTNAGNAAVANVVVVDDNATPGNAADDVTLTLQGGDTDTDGLLDVGETWTYATTHVVTQADLDAGAAIVNVATASGTGADTVSDDATVPVAQDQALAITKDATVPGGTADVAGEVISYTIAVTNAGNAAVANVVVVDDNATPGNAADDVTLTLQGGDTDTDGLLDVGETWTYATTHVVTQADLDAGAAIVNVATASGTGADTVSDDATV
ncbi:MAG: Calx-beta domain-containing protein, partial [Phycisphaerales bacterium]